MFFIMFLIFGFVTLTSYFLVPPVYEKTMALSESRAMQLTNKLDRVLPRNQLRLVGQLYMVAPIVLGILGFILFPDGGQLVGVLAGVAIGLLIPGLYNKVLIHRNRQKFDDQLVDALMIMSSSFRGGLSLIQAMEAVVEEMPDPTQQEFATVLGENKMGVALDEALNHLYNRMPSPSLQQMITAILLARETGGNLPVIFQRIVNVTREHKRIKGQMDTLTIQGKIQGVVMSALPVVFFVVIKGSQPTFFDHMFRSDLGRILLVIALFLEIIGAIMIWKISTFDDF